MYNIERNDFINKKFQTSSMNAFFDHGKDLMKENSWELAMLLSFTCIMVFFVKVIVLIILHQFQLIFVQAIEEICVAAIVVHGEKQKNRN